MLSKLALYGYIYKIQWSAMLKIFKEILEGHIVPHLQSRVLSFEGMF